MVKPDFSKIPKGSTLDEMASFFDVEKDYLRRYHNIYCDLDDLIENEIPRHLVKLFVPPKNKEYERVLMSGQAVSAFSPADILEKSRLFHKEYGVIQTSYDNEAKSKRISFLMEIGKIDVFKYSINRKTIYINHHAPDLVLEKMAEKAGSIFFPLEVETLPNGNLKQITNIEDIRKRWKILRPEMVNYYKGPLADNLIGRIDKDLGNKYQIQDRILASLFYRLYFLPFRDYVKNMEREFDLYLPLFPFKRKVRYQVKIAEQPSLSETGKMLLHIKGKLADTRMFFEIMNGKMPLERQEEDITIKCGGNIDALYKFNKEDGSLASLEANIILNSEDQKNIKKITVEIYQQ